jgi:hypothetical protein
MARKEELEVLTVSRSSDLFPTCHRVDSKQQTHSDFNPSEPSSFDPSLSFINPSRTKRWPAKQTAASNTSLYLKFRHRNAPQPELTHRAFLPSISPRRRAIVIFNMLSIGIGQAPRVGDAHEVSEAVLFAVPEHQSLTPCSRSILSLFCYYAVYSTNPTSSNDTIRSLLIRRSAITPIRLIIQLVQHRRRPALAVPSSSAPGHTPASWPGRPRSSVPDALDPPGGQHGAVH